MASFESIGSLQFRLSKYLLLFERPLLAETTATICVWVANHLKLRRLPLDSWMRDNSDLKDFTVDLFISKAASKVSSDSRLGRLKALALNFFLISKLVSILRFECLLCWRCNEPAVLDRLFCCSYIFRLAPEGDTINPSHLLLRCHNKSHRKVNIFSAAVTSQGFWKQAQ